MDEAMRTAGWIIVIAVASAYATYLVVGSTLDSQAVGTSSPVIVRDSVMKGEHHLSGILMVPRTCDELTLVIEKAGADAYQLTFRTWSEPSVLCIHEPTARAFDTTVFAPSVGVQFVATLDNVSVPIAVYPSIRDSKSR